MSFHNFFSVMGNFIDYLAPLGLTLLLYSTVVLSVGLFGNRFLKNKGALVQSYFLKTCIAMVLLCPVVYFAYTNLGVKTYTIVIDPRPAEKILTSVNSNEHIKHISSALKNVQNSVSLGFQKQVDENNQLSDNEPSVLPDSPPAIEKEPGKINGIETTVEVPPKALRNVTATTSGKSLVHSIADYFLRFFILSWLILSVFLLLKSIIIFFYVKSIIASSEPATSEFQNLAKKAAAKMGQKPPQVYQSSMVESAFITGIFNPVIVIPFNKNFKLIRSRDVFLHEMGHLAHHDNFWKFICQIGLFLFPVQPLLWKLVRELDSYEDFLCDDYVVKFSFDKVSYAERLLNIAQFFRPTLNEEYAGSGIFAYRSRLRTRVERILDDAIRRPARIGLNDTVYIVVVFSSTLILTGFVNIKNKDMDNGQFQNQPTYQKYIYETVMKSFSQLIANRAAFEKSHLKQSETAEKVTPGRLAYDFTSFELLKETKENYSPASSSGKAETSEKSEIDTSVSPLPLVAESIEAGNIVSSSGFSEIYAPKASILARETLMSSGNISAAINTEESAPGGFSFGTATTTGSSSNGYTIPANCAKLINITEDFESLTSVENSSRADYVKQVKISQYSPVWSPDGSLISFTDQQYGIWVVPAEGGEPTLIFDNFTFCKKTPYSLILSSMITFGFSPDGNAVIFQKLLADESKGTKITVKRNDSTGDIDINAEGLIPIIYSVSLQTGETKEVIENAVLGKYSADGRYFGFKKNDSVSVMNNTFSEHNLDIGLIDQETGETKFLTNGGCIIIDYCFSDDNSNIIAVMKKDGETYYQLYRITIATGEIEKITSYIKEISFSAISSENNWIRYIDSSVTPCEVTYLDMETGKEEHKQLPSFAIGAAYSSNSEKACYILAFPGTNVTTYNLFTSPVSDKPAFTEDEKAQPASFELKGNFPNPFNMSTTIEFTLPAEGKADMMIYNALGQKICHLVSGKMSAGTHRIVWDGKNDEGTTVSSGVYLSSLSMGKHQVTKKMTLLK